MIARAARPGRRVRHWRAKRRPRLFLQPIIAAILSCFAQPANAAVGAAVSVFSDDRFRGFSLSEGDPVATLDVSYDAPAGFYAAGSGTIVGNPRDGLRPLGLQLNGGYARPLKSGLTADFGLIHAGYSRYSGLGSRRSYTEAYAGLEGKLLSARLHYSPNYLGRGATTYGELDGQLPVDEITIDAHAGILIPLYGGDDHYQAASHYDWHVGVSRPLGRFILHAALSAGGPREPYYGDYSSGHAITLGVSWAL